MLNPRESWAVSVAGQTPIDHAWQGLSPVMLRNYLANASCDSSVVYIRVPDYASIIGNGSNPCQVHGRFILLDNVTGYRSQYQQKSFLLQIAQ